MYVLGYDIGSSSVKASLVNVESGKCAASAFFPKTEAPILAVKQGWAEQDPQSWWDNLKLATQAVLTASGAKAEEIKAIGISYQMHGLVCVDKNQQVLRPSIIWCDSRAVPYGQKAFQTLGEAQCLSHLLNSPGNFTASKLAWVKENEPLRCTKAPCLPDHQRAGKQQARHLRRCDRLSGFHRKYGHLHRNPACV